MGYYDVDKFSPAPSTHTPAQPGYGSVPEYQASGLPWVTSSIAPNALSGSYQIEFPNVTRFVTIANLDTTDTNRLRIGFTANGVKSGIGNNYYLLKGNDKITFDLRIKTLFLAGDISTPLFSVCAGLTAIPSKFAPVLTGSVSGTNGSWQGVG